MDQTAQNQPSFSYPKSNKSKILSGVERPNLLAPLTSILKNKRVLTALAIGALAYGGWRYFGGSNTPVRTATVVGLGKLQVPADKAVVSFSITAAGATESSAITQGEAAYSRILAGLNQYGDLEISKNTYQIVPSAGGGTVQYVNAARVSSSQPENIGQIVQYLYDNGASTVTQVRYVPEDQDEVEKDLRELAVKDTREKAKQMARAAGAGVGKLISIQEGASTSQTGTPVTADSQTNESGITTLGEIELQTLVTAIYQIR